jgi:hypothetical protein
VVGTYLLDADDLWKPTKLQKQMDFMMTNNAPFTFSFMIASMRRKALARGRSAQAFRTNNCSSAIMLGI